MSRVHDNNLLEIGQRGSAFDRVDQNVAMKQVVSQQTRTVIGRNCHLEIIHRQINSKKQTTFCVEVKQYRHQCIKFIVSWVKTLAIIGHFFCQSLWLKIVDLLMILGCLTFRNYRVQIDGMVSINASWIWACYDTHFNIAWFLSWLPCDFLIINFK